MIVIELKNIVKSYGEKEVLNIESLKISRGKICGIMGPSGAGKSTLLRIINGLEKPTSGSICFDGKKVSFPPELSLRRRMTMVFQKPVLFSTTVYNNVIYGLKVRGRENRQKVLQAIEFVGLKGMEKRNALSLSGGEAQRIALARAIVLEPELLLLDEPTANLDPANVEIIENLLLELNSKKNTTILIVTHNIFQAKRISEEVVFMKNGFVIEKGPTNKVFSRPSASQTAAFIKGEMIF